MLIIVENWWMRTENKTKNFHSTSSQFSLGNQPPRSVSLNCSKRPYVALNIMYYVTLLFELCIYVILSCSYRNVFNTFLEDI